MPDAFQFDVFLSHSAKDKAVVRPLAEGLRTDGLTVWFDEWVLKPGDSIPAKIEEGLEHSRVLAYPAIAPGRRRMLCMSASAFGSDWAQLETGMFRFRDPVNRHRRFLPFDDALLEDTHNAIKLAAKSCDFRAERVDEITHTDRITDKILGSIRMAEIIIADITHNRPNVYYEIGYAHACGKHVLLAARAGTKLHFHISDYPVIFHKSAVSLQKELERRILGLAENGA